MEVYPLKSVEIDTERGIYRVNGEEISKTCTEFNLSFEDGQWSLQTTETKFYAHSDHAS